ncbi:cytochrome c oxidase subunit 2 [Bauldia litoralis]|uniref:Cytochrome c oxidase subunit 2 n=2 Tax=Bauldia litoralis TaxID=665467 RepID=A0A1G6C6L1_9HYPH|nr:cytochrome c oxidase subunit 2 [Bauldia litoralis]
MLAGAALCGFAGPALANQPQPWEINLQPSGSPIMTMIHAFNNGLLLVVTAITILVLALLVIVMVRFNARRNPVPSKTSHNTLIEVVWTVAPILILVGIAIPSFSLLIAQHDPARAIPNYNPEDTLTIKATGMAAWYWTYDYPDNGDIQFESFMLTEDQITDPATQPRLLAVDNNLVVPTGTVVRMLVTAEPLGVIHSFTVPSLGFKIDAIPGRLNETWFLVEREGMYYGQCSELCGRNHAFMPIALQAVSPEKYAAWAELAATDLEAAYELLDDPAGPATEDEAAGGV